MAQLVSVYEGRLHLRIDDDFSDEEVTLLIEKATSIVLDYIKNPTGVWLDTDGVTVLPVPALVRAAILMVMGTLYMDREGQMDPLSLAVQSLLQRQRTPALA